MAKRGPKTDAGKAVVALNAVRHGITAAAIVIPGVESQEEWEAFREDVVAEYAPAGAVEERLAGRVAEMLWRLRRVPRYESEVIAIARERVEADFSKRDLWSGKPRTSAEADARLRDAERCLQLLQELPQLPPHETLRADDVIGILEAIAGDDETLLTEPLPAFADGLADDTIEWNATLLRAALIALGERSGSDAEAVRLNAVGQAIGIRDQRAAERAFVLDELDRMRRERLLPDAVTLVTLTKYESHLNRQLYQAMNELEALQSRRRGQPVPLARIQIHGPGG